jgi:signal peptidase I
MARSLRDRLKGPWRVAVTEGSMVPSIRPGDWLVVSPLPTRWPAAGSVVVFREPLGETLAIKRVAARGGDRVPYAGGYLVLAPGEAWLLADADEKAAASVGSGPPIDSQRFGPVADEALVGRVLFRYWPPRRFGPIPGGPRRAGIPA